MIAIFSRQNDELNFFLKMINSKLDEFFPYYLIRINDDYYYEMYIKFQREKNGWRYDYFNYNARFDGKVITDKELNKFIQFLIENKRNWKQVFSLKKNKNQVKKYAVKFLGPSVENILEIRFEENKNLQVELTKEINLGQDNEREIDDFEDKWSNFSSFIGDNKYAIKTYLKEIKDCFYSYKDLILYHEEAFKIFIYDLCDIVEDLVRFVPNEKEILRDFLFVIQNYEGQIDDDLVEWVEEVKNKIKNLL